MKFFATTSPRKGVLPPQNSPRPVKLSKNNSGLQRKSKLPNSPVLIAAKSTLGQKKTSCWLADDRRAPAHPCAVANEAAREPAYSLGETQKRALSGRRPGPSASLLLGHLVLDDADDGHEDCAANPAATDVGDISSDRFRRPSPHTSALLPRRFVRGLVRSDRRRLRGRIDQVEDDSSHRGCCEVR